MILRAALALGLLGIPTSSAHADEPLLQGGSYEITFRLELPHLERWAIPRTITACISEAGQHGWLILPILSDNNPFADCFAKDIKQHGTSLTYHIACKGRDSAKAQVRYALAPGGYQARIAMTMGAKNMTMTEVQTARRLGGCTLASTGRN